jgi:aminoglycoside phosphotransferase (APT) family kinase protein
MIPETTEPRAGEELDLERLEDYLRDRLPTAFDEIEVSQFPAGSSNLTYLVKVGGHDYVLRRAPVGNTVKSAHDMSREYRALTRLSIVYPPAPEPVLFCDDESVIGAEFYLMERREGLIIRGQTSQYRPRQRVAESTKRDDVAETKTLENSHQLRLDVCKSFIQNLADLHTLDHKLIGFDDLGNPEGYCRRQVEGWTKRYYAAKTHEHPELDSAIKWLNDNIPTECGATVVHNDYKFDNIMLDPDDLTKITAVLDWEMVTVGDPLMDLGTTLGDWMSADAGDDMLNMPFNPRVLMENISRQELVEMYAAASGRDVSNILYYYVFGTFKIAVIAQQIYARFTKGFTQDKRFANFDKFVAALGVIANRAVHTERM